MSCRLRGIVDSCTKAWLPNGASKVIQWAGGCSSTTGDVISTTALQTSLPEVSLALNLPRVACCRQLTIIEVLLVGGAEIYRNTEQDIGKRQYPGGVFDPLGLASGSDERAFNLKTAELKHGRLAMIAFLGAFLLTATLPNPMQLCQTLRWCREMSRRQRSLRTSCGLQACFADSFGACIACVSHLVSRVADRCMLLSAQALACRHLHRERVPSARSPSSRPRSRRGRSSWR